MKFRPLLAGAVAALVSLGGVSEAQYRWVDAEGRVHYSNTRPAAPAPPEAPEPARAPAAEPKALVPEPAPGPIEPKALIEEVLELSGAKKQILQIPAVCQSQLSERQGRMKPADYARLSQIIAESYRPDTLYKAVSDTFKSRFDEKRLLAVRQAWHSPLFKRIAALEAQASTPEGARRMQEFAVELRRVPPHADRLALIRRVDAATRSTDLNVEIALATIRGIALGVDPMMPASQRLKPGQLDQLLSDMRAQIRAPLKNQVLITLLYAYQSLTDEELRAYLAYLESDAGRWFDRVAKDGILSGMTAAADRVGRQMGKSLAADPRPPADPRPSSDPGNGPLTAAQKTWALATSAVLTERNRQRHDVLGGDEYLVGYLTEEEAWERIMYAARTLQSNFDSWKDLGENYLIGREFWSLHQTRDSGDRFRDAYARLLKDPASPWNRHPWETNLNTPSAKPVKASQAR